MRTSTQPQGWLPSLNGLRAVSVIMVIGSHLAYAHPEINGLSMASNLLDGALGVRIFFVISGFLITGLLLREVEQYGYISLRRFYLRRVLRLFPVQFSYIFFLFVLTIITPLKIDLCRYITALTFTKNYACAQWVDGHLWSLSVEEQFYLIWPIALALLRQRYVWILACFLIGSAPFSRAIEYAFGSRVFFWLPSNADGLMIGCLVSLYAQRNLGTLRRFAAWRPSTVRVVSIFIMYVPPYLAGHLLFGKFTVMLGPALQSVAAAILIVSVVYHRGGIGYAFLNSDIVSFIGSLSYSLYVWQMLFLARSDSFGGENEWFLAFPIDLIMISVAAVTSYYVLERPLAQLRSRLHFHPKLDESALPLTQSAVGP